GEAAALIYTAGQSAPAVDFTNWNIFDETSPLNLMRPAETLAVHIWKINSEGIMPDANAISAGRSEERRVGKEYRSRRRTEQKQKSSKCSAEETTHTNT